MSNINNPEYHLVLFGAQNLVNNKLNIEKTTERQAAENDIYAEELSRDVGSVVSNIKVQSKIIKMKGELQVPDTLINDKSLYDLSQEYDRELNKKPRFLRFMRYFKTINNLENTAEISGTSINNIAEDLLDYQHGTKSIKFDIDPTGSTISNGDFSEYSGTPGDDTTDTFTGWNKTEVSGAYVDKQSDGSIKIYRGTGSSNIYQDVFLLANTKYVFSLWEKSDGTGTQQSQILAMDGSLEYVQDDGSTWDVTANNINNLEGFNTDTSYFRRRYFIFTTKNFSGKYRIIIQSTTNNSAVFIKDVTLNLFDEINVFYSANNDFYRFNRGGGTALSTTAITNALILAQDSNADGSTCVLYRNTSDNKTYISIFNSLGGAVASGVEIAGANIFSSQEDPNHVVVDSNGDFHLLMQHASTSAYYYAKVSSAGAILIPYTQLVTSPNSMWVAEKPILDEVNNRFTAAGTYWTGSATRTRVWWFNLDDFTITDKYSPGTNYTTESMIQSTSGKYFLLCRSGSTYSYLILNSDFTVNTALTTLRVATYQIDVGTLAMTSDGHVWMFYSILESNSDRRIYWRVLDKDGATVKAEAQLTTWTNSRQNFQTWVSPLDRVYFGHAHNTDTPSFTDNYRLTIIDPDFDILVANQVVSTDAQTDKYIRLSGYQKTVAISNATLIAEGFTPIDLTDEAGNGSICTWLRIPYAENLQSVIMRIGSDESNYYQYTMTAGYDFNQFWNGWNFLAMDWKTVSTIGTPDDENLDYLALIFTFDGQTDVIEDCAINALLWNDENQTRNYTAYLRKIMKDDVHDMITYTPFDAEFFCDQGIAFGTFQETVLADAIMSGTPIEELITFEGSYDPTPQVRLDLLSASGLGTVKLENLSTGQYIEVGSGLTFATNDVLLLDFKTGKITQNGQEVRFNGGLLDFLLGYNTLKLSGTSGGDTNQNYLTYNTHITYTAKQYVARQFTAGASGYLTEMQVRGYRQDESYSLTDFNWYLMSDSANTPNAVIASGVAQIDSTSQGWFDFTVNYPVVNGVKYWIVLQMRRYWNPDFGLYFISNFHWSADSAEGDVNGLTKGSDIIPTGSPSWSTLNYDMTYKATIQVAPAYSVKMGVTYQKQYL